MSEPRGILLNNPGCIRRLYTVWAGQADIQRDADFVTFKAPEWGLRAIVRILDTYQRQGVDTVRKAITRWSPPSDNNPTDIYVRNVAAVCHVDPDQPILLSQYRVSLIEGIVTQECGSFPYDSATVAKAIELAGDDE